METSKRLFPVEIGYVNLETDGFSVVFRGYSKRPVAWNELKTKRLTNDLNKCKQITFCILVAASSLSIFGAPLVAAKRSLSSCILQFSYRKNTLF